MSAIACSFILFAGCSAGCVQFSGACVCSVGCVFCGAETPVPFVPQTVFLVGCCVGVAVCSTGACSGLYAHTDWN
jgi:hypothetical protein